MEHVLKTELFEVVRHPLMPIEVIRSTLEERFDLERLYYGHGPSGLEFDYIDYMEEHEFDENDPDDYKVFDRWVLTSLVGYFDGSAMDIELIIGPTSILCKQVRSIEMRIVEYFDQSVDNFPYTTTLVARKEIKVIRHLNEFLDELPALLDQQNKLLGQRHYKFCQDEYAALKKHCNFTLSDKEISDYSQEIVTKSLFPLVDKTR